MKIRIIIILLFFSSALRAQIIGDLHVDYSSKFRAAGGFEIGYLMNSKLYTAVNTRIYFGRERTSPVFGTEAIIGADFDHVRPYISLGYITTGGKAIKAHEGFESVTFGGGISYVFSRFSIYKITLAVENYKVDGRINEDVSFILKNGNFIHGLVTFSIGVFGSKKVTHS